MKGIERSKQAIEAVKERDFELAFLIAYGLVFKLNVWRDEAGQLQASSINPPSDIQRGAVSILARTGFQYTETDRGWQLQLEN